MVSTRNMLLLALASSTLIWTACGKKDENRARPAKKNGGTTPLDQKPDGAAAASLAGTWRFEAKTENGIKKTQEWTINLNENTLKSNLTCEKGTNINKKTVEVTAKLETGTDRMRVTGPAKTGAKLEAFAKVEKEKDCTLKLETKSYKYVLDANKLTLKDVNNDNTIAELCRTKDKDGSTVNGCSRTGDGGTPASDGAAPAGDARAAGDGRTPVVAGATTTPATGVMSAANKKLEGYWEKIENKGATSVRESVIILTMEDRKITLHKTCMKDGAEAIVTTEIKIAGEEIEIVKEEASDATKACKVKIEAGKYAVSFQDAESTLILKKKTGSAELKFTRVAPEVD